LRDEYTTILPRVVPTAMMSSPSQQSSEIPPCSLRRYRDWDAKTSADGRSKIRRRPVSSVDTCFHTFFCRDTGSLTCGSNQMPRRLNLERRYNVVVLGTQDLVILQACFQILRSRAMTVRCDTRRREIVSSQSDRADAETRTRVGPFRNDVLMAVFGWCCRCS
jgi:hypothetical protein